MLRPVWWTGTVLFSALFLCACDASGVTMINPLGGPGSGSAGSANTVDGGIGGARISKPGQYAGYSQAVYPGYGQTSQYVSMRDGTKLALDLYRPKNDKGEVVDKPLPVLWLHTPFNRRTYMGGSTLENYPGFASRLVAYGYVVAIVDFRGLYASYGSNIANQRGEWLEPARWDAYDITEWLATQPWSNGRIGMFGCGAAGSSQLQAASTKPPHLQAIFPLSCEFDAYSDAVPGGISPPKGTAPMPVGDVPAAQRDAMAAPVDGDDSRGMLNEAIAQHSKNVDSPGYVPFRDSVGENVAKPWWTESSPNSYLEAMQLSKVAIYFAANWDEVGKSGPFFAFSNVKNPVKLIIGPAKQCDWATVKSDTGFDLMIEELRFFDYWLKDVDNEVMTEPQVHFYTYNAPKGMEWQSSVRWPMLNEQRTRYYLGEKTLAIGPAPDGKDEIKVDYSVTPETAAQKGLVYETEQLATDLQITGHPSMELWVSSTANDGDFVATLQDVAADGTVASYNVSGRLRASHRKLAQAPYNNLGLPWHRSFEQDAQQLMPGEPAQLLFDLLPISIIIKAEHKLRLVLTFSAGALTPRVDPAPMVSVYRDGLHRSALILPVVRTGL
ncbi:MAG TPA: CocE/NonD family hydrolase [Polyangiales bacterium]|nr:CocE/NonD family hydrolase [Polyangiales bacterium]